MPEIDLSVFRGKKYKVLSGRGFGENVRREHNLNEIDKQDFVQEIVIPEDVYSLNSSFFAGLFQESLRKLGEKRFREKYLFRCTDTIRKNVNDGIFHVMNTLDLLGGDE